MVWPVVDHSVYNNTHFSVFEVPILGSLIHTLSLFLGALSVYVNCVLGGSDESKKAGLHKHCSNIPH